MIYDNKNWFMDEGYWKSKKYGRLHRYIYEQYNGPIPKGYIVHHDNEDKTDNTPKNLIAMTRKAHTILHMTGNTYCLGKILGPHSEETKKKISEAGKGHTNNAKLTIEDVELIRIGLSMKFTQQSIAEVFNVSNGQISNIKTGRKWKDV